MSWSPGLQQLAYAGFQLPRVRKNLCNLVVVADPTTPTGAETLQVRARGMGRGLGGMRGRRRLSTGLCFMVCMRDAGACVYVRPAVCFRFVTRYGSTALVYGTVRAHAVSHLSASEGFGERGVFWMCDFRQR